MVKMRCNKSPRIDGQLTLAKTLTDPFITFEHQNLSQDVSELREISRSPFIEALKLWNGWSGHYMNARAHACILLEWTVMYYKDLKPWILDFKTSALPPI